MEIAGGVVAHLSLGEGVALLAAAELHQAAGDIEAAIWVVEQVDSTTAAALSLADPVAGVPRPVVQSARLQRRARDALKEALRVKNRAASVRHHALVERAAVNLAQNRKAAARKDLETVLSEDPPFPGLAEALDVLPS